MRTRRPIAALPALIALAPALLPVSATAASFVQSPYLQAPSLDGMSVVWEADAALVGEVRVTSASGDLGAPGVLVFPTGDAATRQEVRVDGLDASSEYAWKVVLGDGSESEPSTLRTGVPAGEPFKWLLFGDTRSFHEVHAAVVAAMTAEPGISFGIQTGDMVSNGEVAEEWDAYFDIEHPLMRQVPVFPVIGNHDEADGEASELVERFIAPDNSPAPEHYYSFRYGAAHFTVVDGHVSILGFDGCLYERDLFMLDCWTTEQVDWVKTDLEAAALDPDVEHIFVLTHVGPYSSKDNRDGSMQVRRLLPLFQAMGVTAILSGHDHYYEHGESAFGMPYIISGGGGASLYEVGTPSPAPHTVVYAESTEHYVLVEMEGPAVRFTAKKPDGTIIDTFEASAPPTCEADGDCAQNEAPPECLSPGFCSSAGHCAFDCVVEGGNPFPLEPEGEPAADGEPTGAERSAASAPTVAPEAPAEPAATAASDDEEADSASSKSGSGGGCRAGEGPDGPGPLGGGGWLLALVLVGLFRRSLYVG